MIVFTEEVALKYLKTNQQNLFYSPLSDMLDMNNPLIASANAIDWKILVIKVL
ncbi:MAG: hypothetical protein KBD88_05210 [Aliarcobacter sp.]|nr:hypothetical protein [Aliarcobacter sp.]